MLCATATAANTVRFGKGTLTVTYVARNAVRVQYGEGGVKNELPDWVYVSHKEEQHADITVDIDTLRQVLTVKNRAGENGLHRHQSPAAPAGGHAGLRLAAR